MSAKNLFVLLAIASLSTWTITGIAILFTTHHDASMYAREAAQRVSHQIARALDQNLKLYQAAIVAAANDVDLVERVLAGDQGGIRNAEARLAKAVDGTLLIRVLPADVRDVDESRKPRMGYADLELVRAARDGKAVPMIHEANTPDEHLAIAARLPDPLNAVLLASLTTKPMREILAGAALENGAIELKQGALRLAFFGDESLVSGTPDAEAKIGNGTWTVMHWLPHGLRVNPLWFGLAWSGGLVMLGVALWYGFRQLTAALRSDQQSLANLFGEVWDGTSYGNYPIQFAELAPLISVTQQFRRTRSIPSKRPQQGISVELETGVPDSFSDIKEPSKVKTSHLDFEVPASIFRAYDIRGIVGDSLTPKLVEAIGKAIGSEALDAGDQYVIIGRDGRLSSPDLSAALARGLQASGRHVIDIGLVPTPVVYFATHLLNSKTGVMITGSHNPPDYNGLKIVIGGMTLSGDRIQRLRERIETENYTTGDGVYQTRDVLSDYLERIVDDTQVGRPLKVVVDCGNGAAGVVAPALLERLGCDIVPLYCDVDGSFPNHHPDPSKPENLETLIRTVRGEGADLGVAFDGDGDRLGLVDSSGKIIWPDRQMMVFAADVLSRQPGADIIYDVKCTRHLASEIVRHGGRPVMWKTGHSLIKAKIKETGAMLAGEMSGHIFFKERWYGFDDGIYSAARMIEIVSGDPRSSAEIFDELPDSLNTPELNVSLEEGENFRFIEQLKALANFPDAHINDIDGLRVDFADGWGLVRASNTTPSLVIRFEADNPSALARIQQQFETLMQQVKPGLTLPF